MATQFMLWTDVYSNMCGFYQVMGRTAKMVTLRRVRANRTTGTPIENGFNDWEKDIRKKIDERGQVSLGMWKSAEMWNGEPVNEHNGNLY